MTTPIATRRCCGTGPAEPHRTNCISFPSARRTKPAHMTTPIDELRKALPTQNMSLNDAWTCQDSDVVLLSAALDELETLRKEKTRLQRTLEVVDVALSLGVDSAACEAEGGWDDGVLCAHGENTCDQCSDAWSAERRSLKAQLAEAQGVHARKSEDWDRERALTAKAYAEAQRERDEARATYRCVEETDQYRSLHLRLEKAEKAECRMERERDEANRHADVEMELRQQAEALLVRVTKALKGIAPFLSAVHSSHTRHDYDHASEYQHAEDERLAVAAVHAALSPTPDVPSVTREPGDLGAGKCDCGTVTYWHDPGCQTRNPTPAQHEGEERKHARKVLKSQGRKKDEWDGLVAQRDLLQRRLDVCVKQLVFVCEDHAQACRCGLCVALSAARATDSEVGSG